jgi:hypothetical protein
MIKTYEFNYSNHDAEACFEVNTDEFTPEHAKATLDFFIWDYDLEGDPIDEVMIKYALKAIKIATFENFNLNGVINEFYEAEGYCPVDGSSGILLKSVCGYEFNPLFMEVKIITE